MSLKEYLNLLDKREDLRTARTRYEKVQRELMNYCARDLTGDLMLSLAQNKFKEIPLEEGDRYWNKNRIVFYIGEKHARLGFSRPSDFIYAELPSIDDAQKFIGDHQSLLKRLRNNILTEGLLGVLTITISLPLTCDRFSRKRERIERCFDLKYSPKFGEDALRELLTKLKNNPE